LKTIYTILLILSFTSLSFAQKTDTAWVAIDNYPLLVNSKQANFGNVIQGEKQTFKFKLKNTGEDPLVIWHVTTSCGCTSPNWTEKPVLTNEEAIVKVKFKSTDLGVFNKSVFVYTNFNDRPIKLSLTGIVIANKSESQITKRNTNFNSTLPKTN